MDDCASRLELDNKGIETGLKFFPFLTRNIIEKIWIDEFIKKLVFFLLGWKIIRLLGDVMSSHTWN